jgi:phosphatidylserine/phosphatidylglycerophosphate/cardiolipin synthase-like enzyme
MRTLLINAVLFVLLFTGSISAQSIIINELYNSGSSDEWVEMLVVQDQLDIRNWSLRDFNGSGVAQTPLVFSNNGLWNNLRKGTVIVIGRAENTFLEDLDPSDYTLTVKSSNSIYLAGNVFSIAGSSDAVQIRDASLTHVHGISWGSGNAGSLPNPKTHFTAASSSNTSTFFNEDDVSKLPILTNWTQNSTTTSRGLGNTTNNLNWINSLRARAEGSGTVKVTPIIIPGDSLINISFNYKKDPLYAVNTLKIIFPQDFTWSQNLSSVSISNFTAATSVNADTILFTNINFANDSVVIGISSVRTAIYTGNYKFKFLSGINPVLAEVNPLPIITVYGAPIPIAQTKVNDAAGVALRIGDLVTVRGIITVGRQFGSPSYLQDNSGGMSIFGSGFSNAIQIGDEVVVTGIVSQFNGLNQLSFQTLHSIVSSGNTIEPLLVTPSQLANDGVGGIENYEGRLVRLNGVLVTELNGSSVTNWAYKNYRLTGANPSDTVQIRIDDSTQIIGMVAPAGRFDVVGVLSQFKTNVPFIGGYQLMPRIPADIISEGPIIEKFPEEVALTSNSISLEWATINPGTSRVRYGKTTNYELGVIAADSDLRTIHNVTISGLTAATIYNLQAFSVSNSDTSFSGNIISSTSSAFPTTGNINVYFNKSVFTGVSSGVNANANADLKALLLQRINNAKRSIDVALYSLSGTVGADIASALVNARNRGVKIRVIGEYDTRTTAPWSTLQNNGIPYINDLIGSNDGSGLFHNKFFIIDYRNGAPDSVWVITGSWNPTDPGTNDDRQNVIEIQDVALAGAYTREFEEMWGSITDVPSSSNARFGSRKLNNTPHNFVIRGRKIECYFSPSDRTSFNIARTIGKSKKSINVASLTLTRRELADSIIAVKNRSSKARVILSNNTDMGTQFPYLQSNGVDIRLKGFTTGLLHHKYAVVDAELQGQNPIVITGSHNWSSSAENSNDENTLIISDAQIANFYLQEFAARYYEAGGIDSIIVTSVEDENFVPAEYSLSQNYPNPFNPVTNINFSIPQRSNVELEVFNALGEKVSTLINEIKEAGSYKITFNAVNLTSGVYFYRIAAGYFAQTKKLILIK